MAGHQGVLQIEAKRKPAIGTFDGNRAMWPIFREKFIIEVDSKDFSPAAKLIMLQEACVGAAASTLGPWLPTPENYAPAWKTMRETYDDTYLATHQLMTQMFQVPVYEQESFISLRAALDSCRGVERQVASTLDLLVAREQLVIHVYKMRYLQQAKYGPTP